MVRPVQFDGSGHDGTVGTGLQVDVSAVEEAFFVEAGVGHDTVAVADSLRVHFCQSLDCPVHFHPEGNKPSAPPGARRSLRRGPSCGSPSSAPLGTPAPRSPRIARRLRERFQPRRWPPRPDASIRWLNSRIIGENRESYQVRGSPSCTRPCCEYNRGWSGP